ncbi:hypothetical protein FZC76_22200 [Sutcliffiella horikoshii]|uniref:Uncharacterized protein n=1 Tax=Sutcliffiella horikoshii TaxID=79883 RepID=A0A5D4SCL9_9BACI|nr:hypothetical protein FZC76_22200 [Sutcliffiella horikoshii]
MNLSVPETPNTISVKLFCFSPFSDAIKAANDIHALPQNSPPAICRCATASLFIGFCIKPTCSAYTLS